MGHLNSELCLKRPVAIVDSHKGSTDEIDKSNHFLATQYLSVGCVRMSSADTEVSHPGSLKTVLIDKNTFLAVAGAIAWLPLFLLPAAPTDSFVSCVMI